MFVVAHVDVVLCPHGIEAIDIGSICSGSNIHWFSWSCRTLSISRFDRFATDDLINFGHHKNTNHLLRPALEVLAVEARNVRDRESGGFIVDIGHVNCWLISVKKRTWALSASRLRKHAAR